MLGKTLLNLDEATRILAPDLEPNSVIESHASGLMRKHLLRSISPENLLSTALEMNEFVQKLPHRMNAILERASVKRRRCTGVT